MATKRFLQYVESQDFQTGWANLLEGAATSTGLERLLHVDLLMRISGFVKKLKIETEQALTIALEAPLPSLDIVASSNELPPDAKPAEIRENVAIALQYATGEWVHQYLVASLASEDRSQRCRVRLVERLVERTPCIEVWMDDLLDQQSLRNLRAETNLNSAAKRLKEIALALGHGVRQKRTNLQMSEAAGTKLAKLASSMIQITKKDSLPKQLAPASAELAVLLDELLNVELSLIVDPATYSSLAVVRNWWQMIPYPDELVRALKPVVSKLDTAVIIRARAGQKSDALVDRLADALGGRNKSSKRLLQIAETQPGLLPEVDDWLRGRDRSETRTGEAVTASLQAVADHSVLTQFAPLLLLSAEMMSQVEREDIDPREALKTVTREIFAYAQNNQIETFGEVGSVVEYTRKLHSSQDGRIPTEAKVQILRAGALRRRVDGGYDVLVKATIE